MIFMVLSMLMNMGAAFGAFIGWHVVECVESVWYVEGQFVVSAVEICQYPAKRSKETKNIMPGGISSTVSSHLGIGYT
jgi:hypothetical protein